MRCKSCKRKIENEKLFRCPHCGKPIVRKKKADIGELLSIIPFFVVSGAYAILNFSTLFFKCEYYSSSVLIIALVIYTITIPFIIGNYNGMKRSIADCIPIVISIPFIVNWFVSVFAVGDTIITNAFSAAYYFSVIIVLLLTDIIMIFKVSGIIGRGNTVKWICLALGIAEFIFTVIYFSITKDVKLFAAFVMGVNSLLPAFTAYHVILRDNRE